MSRKFARCSVLVLSVCVCVCMCFVLVLTFSNHVDVSFHVGMAFETCARFRAHSCFG